MPEGKAPPIGRLRNYAGVFVWTDVAQSEGPSAIPRYQQIGHCWCSLKVNAGEMMLLGAQIDERAGPRGTHTLRTRFREDLTIRHMFEIAGKRYKVVGVVNDDARRFTQFDVEEFGDATIIAQPPRSIWDRGQSTWDDKQSPWDEER